MLRAGLTGGIACGKSAVAAMLRERGCRMLEADKMGHAVIEPGEPAYDDVVREFGKEILVADGRVDRSKLARVVFANRARLERLNQIIHPRVADALDEEFAEMTRARFDGVAVVEAALLVESNYYKKLDRLIVVWCRPEQQLERLTNSRTGRGMSRAEAKQRIAAQMPMEEKRGLADDLIDTSVTLDQTREQVEALVARLKELAAERGRVEGQGRGR
jgi:dephospho-CoA kinase